MQRKKTSGCKFQYCMNRNLTVVVNVIAMMVILMQAKSVIGSTIACVYIY